MRNGKNALVLMILLFALPSIASAEDPSDAKPLPPADCLQPYLKARDAVALKHHVRKGRYLSNKQVEEARSSLPAACTTSAIYVEIVRFSPVNSSDEVFKAAFTEIPVLPNGVPESSQDADKPRALGPMGEENIRNFIWGLSMGAGAAH